MALFAGPLQSARAQPVPLAVKATQHWVLYARLHGGGPFAVAEPDGVRGRIWWFDARGGPIAITRSQRSMPQEDPGGPAGPPGLVVVLPQAAATGVARAAVPPTPSPEPRYR